MKNWLDWKKENNYKVVEKCCDSCDHIEIDWEMQYCTRTPERWNVSVAGICDKWKGDKKDEI